VVSLGPLGPRGVGAYADVTVYTPDANRATMFSTPRYVVKGGVVVVEEGQLRRAPAGRRLHVRPAFDHAVTRDIERYFDEFATVRFANYPVGDLRDAPVVLGAGAR
jgi:formylmethanofuran dehydrogenase subunit A